MLGPKVDSVTPNRGPEAGGTSVTISGQNLSDTVSVTFDGTPAASFAVVDDNTVTAVTPFLGYTGPSEVVITNSIGITSDIYPVDSSGNSLNGGSYGFVTGGSAGAYPNFVTGLASMSDDDAFQTADPLVTMSAAGAGVPAAALDMNTDLSVECWIQISDDHASEGPLVAFSTHLGLEGFVYVFTDGAGAASIAWARDGTVFGNTQEVSFDASGVITDGLAHHVVVTAGEGDGFGGNVHCWVDAVELTDATVFVDGFSNGLFTTPYGISVNSRVSSAGLDGTLDELAFYSSTILDGTQIAAHYAAAFVSASAYATAVLADAPTGYFHFNDGRGNGLFRYLSPEGWHVGRIGVGPI